jgi:hypothetical protein
LLASTPARNTQILLEVRRVLLAWMHEQQSLLVYLRSQQQTLALHGPT